MHNSIGHKIFQGLDQSQKSRVDDISIPICSRVGEAGPALALRVPAARQLAGLDVLQTVDTGANVLGRAAVSDNSIFRVLPIE